jgi:signal peptidase II
MPRIQNSHIRIALILSLVVAVDQVTKMLAANLLEHSVPVRFANDFFWLLYAENRGALLSLGEGLSPEARFWLFSVGNGLVLTLMLAWVLAVRNLAVKAQIGISLVLGGGIGNWLSRVLNDGTVTDFLNVGYGIYRSGIFNVADIAIVAGVVQLLRLIVLKQ